MNYPRIAILLVSKLIGPDGMGNPCRQALSTCRQQCDTLIFRWQPQPRKSQQLFTQYLLNLQFT